MEIPLSGADDVDETRRSCLQAASPSVSFQWGIRGLDGVYNVPRRPNRLESYHCL
jgi:hypothetical protein